MQRSVYRNSLSRTTSGGQLNAYSVSASLERERQQHEKETRQPESPNSNLSFSQERDVYNPSNNPQGQSGNTTGAHPSLSRPLH